MCGYMGRLRVILFIFIVLLFFISIFACYRFSTVLVCFSSFSVLLACLKTEPCPYVPTYLHLAIL